MYVKEACSFFLPNCHCSIYSSGGAGGTLKWGHLPKMADALNSTVLEFILSKMNRFRIGSYRVLHAVTCSVSLASAAFLSMGLIALLH